MTEYCVFRAVETWERVSVFLCMPSAQLCLKVCSVFLRPNSVDNPCLFDVSECLQECELWAVNATSNGLVVVEVETEPCPPHAKAIYRAVTPSYLSENHGKSHTHTHLPACVIMQFFSPKQFTVGVLNSFLKGVRLFPGGGVRLSGCLQFVSQSGNSFVSLVVSGSPDVSRFICLRCLAGGVSLSGCLPMAIHLSPSLASAARLSGCIIFTCFPLFVSQPGWCPALWTCLFTCLPSFVSHSV